MRAYVYQSHYLGGPTFVVLAYTEEQALKNLMDELWKRDETVKVFLADKHDDKGRVRVEWKVYGVPSDYYHTLSRLDVEVIGETPE